ncbi:MAG: endolytic transglycosylase MltG [Bdellovibrionota bacterium]
MRTVLAAFISIAALALAIACWQVFEFTTSSAGTDSSPVIFDIPPGMGLNQAARVLQQKGLVKDDFKFRLYARFVYGSPRIKIGEYNLNQTMTVRQILDVLTQGQSIEYSVTVPEGYNMFEITTLLNSRWPGRGDAFFKLVTNQQFVQSLLGEKRSSLEGYLFPDTYSITKYTQMEGLVRMMFQRFQEAYLKATVGAPIQMKRHEHVTLASVIEKETGAPEERPMIASVFHNRLMKKMRLQSDPTIIYGIWVATQKEKMNITKADILAPTPYNTYTTAALPVGPIANPGYEALAAAVRPLVSENLYFVSRNDGTHVFTTTYEDHNKAVKSFQLNRQAREGKSWRDLQKRKAK